MEAFLLIRDLKNDYRLARFVANYSL